MITHIKCERFSEDLPFFKNGFIKRQYKLLIINLYTKNNITLLPIVPFPIGFLSYKHLFLLPHDMFR
jgi:hypothetical protein